MYNHKTDKYVGVFANRYIRQWSADCKDINKIKKQKLAKNIHELISLQDNDIIVVYTDGTCVSLQSALVKTVLSLPSATEKSIVDCTASKEQIINVQTFIHTNDTILVTYFVKHHQDNVDIVFQKMNTETLTTIGKIQRLAIVRKNHSLAGYTVNEMNLITIWSDKRIFMQSLSTDENLQYEMPGNFISMLNVVHINQPLSIAGIGRIGIAIYGANTNQEGGSLIMFNAQFSIVHFKQFFKVYFKHSSIWTVNNYILLGFGDNLACISFTATKERLSNMIGTQRTFDTNLSFKMIDQDFINEEQQLEEMIEFDRERQMIANRDKNFMENKLMNDSIDDDEMILKNDKRSKTQKSVESMEMFEKDLRKLHLINNDMIAVEIYRNKNMLDNVIQMKLCSNVNAKNFTAIECEMLVDELEQYGASEIEITDTLIPLLINGNLTKELQICLRRYINISECMLIKSLAYLLDNINRNEQQFFTSINLCLSCAFNESSILEPIRSNLTYSNVMILLTHIIECLQSVDEQFENRPSLYGDSDEDTQLIKWFTVIIDANFQEFVLSKNADLLRKIAEWKSVIDEYLSVCKNVHNVTSKLYNLLDGKGNAIKGQSSKWYSIELVKLY